jgi:hypothetical protein
MDISTLRLTSQYTDMVDVKTLNKFIELIQTRCNGKVLAITSFSDRLIVLNSSFIPYQCIIIYIFKHAFCPPHYMICKHLLTKHRRAEFAVSVPETNAETVETGDIHLHSEYQAINNGKYRGVKKL